MKLQSIFTLASCVLPIFASPTPQPQWKDGVKRLPIKHYLREGVKYVRSPTGLNNPTFQLHTVTASPPGGWVTDIRDLKRMTMTLQTSARPDRSGFKAEMAMEPWAQAPFGQPTARFLKPIWYDSLPIDVERVVDVEGIAEGLRRGGLNHEWAGWTLSHPLGGEYREPVYFIRTDHAHTYVFTAYGGRFIKKVEDLLP